MAVCAGLVGLYFLLAHVPQGRGRRGKRLSFPCYSCFFSLTFWRLLFPNLNGTLLSCEVTFANYSCAIQPNIMRQNSHPVPWSNARGVTGPIIKKKNTFESRKVTLSYIVLDQFLLNLASGAIVQTKRFPSLF